MEDRFGTAKAAGVGLNPSSPPLISWQIDTTLIVRDQINAFCFRKIELLANSLRKSPTCSQLAFSLQHSKN